MGFSTTYRRRTPTGSPTHPLAIPAGILQLNPVQPCQPLRIQRGPQNDSAYLMNRIEIG